MPALILVPVTLVPLGEQKLETIVQQAQGLNGEVVLLHVLPRGTLRPDMVTPSEAMARTHLDTLSSVLRRHGVPARSMVKEGPVVETIINEAEALDAALIILGMTVRSRFPSILRGGVTDEVLRTAPCPVLLVRAELPAEPCYPLRSFADDAARAGAIIPRWLGLRTVEVSRIVGSVNRVHELGPDFLPIKPNRADQERFQLVRAAMLRGDPLPPIELYKLGFGYYVVDGHHRVAAARQLGPSTELDALVTEFLPVNDQAAHELFVARRQFEQATGVTRIGASRPATYQTMLRMIQHYQRDAAIPDIQEAARRWYSSVFAPLRQQIRTLGFPRQFPGDRPADILARAIEWWEQEHGQLPEVKDLQEVLEQFILYHDTLTAPST